MLQLTVNAAGMNTETTGERDIFKVTGGLYLKFYQDRWGKVPFLPGTIVMMCTVIIFLIATPADY